MIIEGSFDIAMADAEANPSGDWTAINITVDGDPESWGFVDDPNDTNPGGGGLGGVALLDPLYPPTGALLAGYSDTHLRRSEASV